MRCRRRPLGEDPLERRGVVARAAAASSATDSRRTISWVLPPEASAISVRSLTPLLNPVSTSQSVTPADDRKRRPSSCSPSSQRRSQ